MLSVCDKMATLMKICLDFLVVEGQFLHMHGIVALITSLRPSVMHTGGYPENMMVGGTHGEINPNSSWLNSKGMWLAYMLGVLLLHLILLSFPFLSVAVVWTLTNLTHNLAMFVFLHTVKGTPWEPNDQGLSRRLTHWEQIDCGEQFTATRKFLTVVPIALFFLTSFYTKYDSLHFGINLIALTLVLVPKLPQFHLVRLFGINKY